MSSAFRPRDALLLFLLASFWGHSFLFIKIAVMADVPPGWIVTARMLTGGLLLVLIGRLTGAVWPRDFPTMGKLTVAGILGAALPWAGQAWAQRYLDSGLTAVLNACTPLATLGMAIAAGQERLQRNRLLGIGCAIAGTLIIIGGEVQAGRSLAALLVAALATLGYAFSAVYTRAQLSGRVGYLPAAALQLLAGGVFLAPCAAAIHGPPPAHLEPAVLLALLALGVLGTGLAFLVFFTLLANVGATNTSMVTYIAPIIALAAGALYRGERFGSNVLLGGVVLLFGVWLVQRTPPGEADAQIRWLPYLCTHAFVLPTHLSFLNP